jgi:hypothetical protein
MRSDPTARAFSATAAAMAAMACLGAVAQTASAGGTSAAPARAAALTPAQKCTQDGYPISPTLSRYGAAAAVKTKPQTVAGWAFLDSSLPLVGASISIRTSTGGTVPLLPHGLRKTGTSGAFLVAVRTRPRRFTVVASGGRVGGKRFRGTLRLQVRNLSPAATVYVNPASTLVEAYLASHPARSLGTASSFVKSFLAVPPDDTLTFDLRYSSVRFDGSRFLREAKGRVNPFLQRLARELNRGKRHPFAGADAPRGLGVDLFSWFGKSLAAGAVGYVGKLGMGWILSQFGVDSGVDDQMDRVSSQLDEINRQLTVLGRQVDQLVVQTDRQYLATLAKDLDDARSDVASHMSDLQWVADMSQEVPRPTDEEIEAQACIKLAGLKAIATGGTSFGYVQVKINGSFFPQGTLSESMTQAGAWVIRDKYRWWTTGSTAELERLLSYWGAIQASWLSLKLEWEHAVAPCSATATAATCEALRWASTFLSDTAAQRETMPTPVAKGTWIDRPANLMWAPTNAYNSYTHPPPATYDDTFLSHNTLAHWAPGICVNYAITICAIEGVGRAAEQYGSFNDWRVPSDAQMAALIDGWGASYPSPAAYLSADPPSHPGASAAWLAQGKNQVWTGDCYSPYYLSCIRYDLTNGSHPYVDTQYADGRPSETAGFLLVRAMIPDVYWTARQTSLSSRYVGTRGTDDLNGVPNDCTSYPTPCKTIAQAVSKAAPGDVIRLGGGTFAGGFTISKNVTLHGNGANMTTISGGSPVVRIAGGTPRIEGVKITGGTTGITTDGGATLADIVLSGNNAGSGTVSALGNQSGTTTLLRSTVSGNIVNPALGNAAPVFVSAGIVRLIDSTVANNSGGAYIERGGTLVLINSTIVKNDLGSPQKPGIYNQGAVSMANTLLADNSNVQADCIGFGFTALPGGHNVIKNPGPEFSCRFDAAGSSGNIIGVDPKVGPFGPNGGTTGTAPLLDGSIAIGAGDPATCADPASVGGLDQRGYVRPNGSCDIGAYDSKAQNEPSPG